MAWYDDLWSGIKQGVSGVASVVKDVAPLIPLFLKKGGSVTEFKDTPTNRKKVEKLFMKLHPNAKKIRAKKVLKKK